MSRLITSEILDRQDLSASEKLVLIAIASHGEVAFPSQARLAHLTSFNVRTIKRVINSLRAKSIIVTDTTRKSLTYAIAVVGDTESPKPPSVLTRTGCHHGHRKDRSMSYVTWADNVRLLATLWPTWKPAEALAALLYARWSQLDQDKLRTCISENRLRREYYPWISEIQAHYDDMTQTDK